MKIFVALVFGAIAIGVLLVAAASALFVSTTEHEDAGMVEEIGVEEVNAFPRADIMAIEISWTALTRNATYVLQRKLNPQEDAWEDIAIIEPDSALYKEGNSATYVDEDVEHRLTYHYRFSISTTDGSMGISRPFEVTAVKP